MKKLIVYLLTAAMFCGIIFTANGSPVYAAEPEITQDSVEDTDPATDEKIFTEDERYDGTESGKEPAGDISEDIDSIPEMESLKEDEISDEDLNAEQLRGSDDEYAPEEEITPEEDERADALGAGEPLEGTVQAADLQQNKSYILTGNAEIILADGDNVNIGSISKKDDDSDFRLTIKAKDGDAGTGKLTLSGFYLDRAKNSLDIQGGIITVSNIIRPGRDFYMKGGELHSVQYISAYNVQINGGLLEVISNYGTNPLAADGDMEMTGGVVRLISKDYKALVVAGDLTISGGELTAIALNQGTSKGNQGIVCNRTLTVKGDAVVSAQGDTRAITAGKPALNYKIELQDTQMIHYPDGGLVGEEKVDQYGYATVVDSDNKPAPVVRIAPASYQAALEADKSEIDFGVLTFGYDADAAAGKKTSIKVTNKSTQAVDFLMPHTLNFEVALAEGSLSDVASGDSVTFELTPKTAIDKDKGNDLLTIRTEGENGASVSIPLILRVGYFLEGSVNASSLGQYNYELLENTTINLAAADNKTISGIQCKGYTFTIDGSDSGKLTIDQGIVLGEEGTSKVIIKHGTISFGSSCIWGAGSVTIRGGIVSAPTNYIQLTGPADNSDFVMEGGTLTLTTEFERELIFARNITITGGKLELTGKGGHPAIKSNYGDISISAADVSLVTNGDYAINTNTNDGNITIGAGTKLYAKAAKEAIALHWFGGDAKITVDNSLTIQKPVGGFIAPEGDNKGHIVDADGNTAKLVQIGNGPLGSTLTADPESLDFGRTAIGYATAPDAKTVTVTNDGTTEVTFIQPTSEKYDIAEKTEAELTVPAGESITFSVRPKTGLGYGEGSETLTVETMDDQWVDIELFFSIEYLLSGTVEAEDLAPNKEYTITGDTVIHIGSGVNKTIYRIVKDSDAVKPNITFTGEEDGTLTFTQQAVGQLGDLTLEGGTVQIYRLAGSNVTVTGGKAELHALQALYDGTVTVSGGVISVTSDSGSEGTAPVYGKNINITGGKITAAGTIVHPVMEASDTLSITGGTLSLSTTKDTPLKGKNITIGGNALIDATTSAEGFEAVTLNDYSKGKITIADTVNLVNPAGGYVAESGANTGHIVDADGNTVKTVRFYPVVLEADPDPVDFGSGVLGYIPDEQTVTIKNTDSREVTLSPIASDYYTIGDYSVSTLASGESATFTIQPKEGAFTVAGPHEEILKVMTNEADIFKKLPVRFSPLDPGDKIWIADIAPQTYTGSEIKPAPVVYYQGHRLNASDYTVKYSGNKNVKRNKKGEVIEGAKVTVTGKGNFAGKTSKSFMILPKSIGDGTKTPAEQITAGTVHILKNSKASPVLTYGTYQLNSKDYKVENANKKYKENAEVTVTGKGNFTGSVKVDVIVANKKDDLKTLNVVVDGGTNITFDPSKDEEAVKALIEGKIKVYDKADKTKTTPLTRGTHYEIISPSNLSSAGTKTIRIVALGDYSGSQTKKITVKPLAVKASAGNGRIETNAATPGGVKEGTYTYKPSGVTIGSKLEVKYVVPGADPGDAPIFEKTLTEGKDYKLSYSNNKAASTATKKASYTVTFTGNYKGTPQLKNVKKTKKNPAIDDYSFTISRVAIGTAGEKPASGVEVVIPDVVYSGKADLYTSAPYVLIDGVQLSSKNYSVSCYKTSGRADTDRIGKKNKLSIAAEDPSATVYVKITGKGNYEGTITKAADDSELAYRVLKKADNTVYDLSKARVTIYAKGYDPAKKNNKILKSVSYNGKARRIDDYDIDGTVVVEYKFSGKKYTRLVEGKDYELEYLNNREKGKAVLIVKGLTGNEYEPGKTRSFLGVKRAGFSIGTKSIKDLLINPFAE